MIASLSTVQDNRLAVNYARGVLTSLSGKVSDGTVVTTLLA